jgi:hypothetical protein
MRVTMVLAPLAGFGLLAACAAADALAPEEPKITLRYQDSGAYPQMVKLAESYCADEHGLAAQLYERHPAGEGYLATFTCR